MNTSHRLRLIASALAALGLAACGEVPSPYADASGGDDTVDADTSPDAEPPTGAANVIAKTRCCQETPDTGKAGVEIVSVDVNGQPRDRVQTDANGEATIEVQAGGSVTAIYPPDEDDDVYLTTRVDVRPGDTLEFGDRFTSPPQNRGTMTVTWPAQAGLRYVHVYAGCSYAYADTATSGNSVAISMRDCGNASEDFVLVGYDVNSNFIRWALVDDVQFVAGGTVSVTSFQQPGSFSVNVTGLPAFISYGYVRADSINGTTGGYGVYISDYSNGTISGTRPWMPGSDGVSVELYLSRNNFGSQSSWRRLPPNTNTFAAAMPPFLPWVGDAVASIAAHRAVWIQEGDAPYDATIVTLYWYTQSQVPNGGPSYTEYYWRIIAPPGITELPLPDLPPALEQFEPPVDFQLNPEIRLLDSSALDGWDAARTAPEHVIMCPTCGLSPDSPEYPDVRESYGGGGGSGKFKPRGPMDQRRLLDLVAPARMYR